MSDLRKDIQTAINRASAENESDTPDFILAQYLIDSLAAFDKATQHRDSWRGFPTLEEQMRLRAPSATGEDATT